MDVKIQDTSMLRLLLLIVIALPGCSGSPDMPLLRKGGSAKKAGSGTGSDPATGTGTGTGTSTTSSGDQPEIRTGTFVLTCAMGGSLNTVPGETGFAIFMSYMGQKVELASDQTVEISLIDPAGALLRRKIPFKTSASARRSWTGSLPASELESNGFQVDLIVPAGDIDRMNCFPAAVTE